jgi:hypothetical protein
MISSSLLEFFFISAEYDGGMENKIINEYIEEFFPMRKGEFILNPTRMISFSPGILISRKAIKHIVEQRSLIDRFDERAIKLLFQIARDAIMDPQIIAKNNNVKYPNSKLLGRFDSELNKGIMVVLEDAMERERSIITIFCKEARQFRKMQKNNP